MTIDYGLFNCHADKSVGIFFVQHPSGGFFCFDKKRVDIITI